jgi:hypothetical protein
VLTLPYTRIQGVLSHNGRWWFGSSAASGYLYYWVSGSTTAWRYPWVSSAEGLSYWEDPNNPDLIWSLREYTGQRNVFHVQQQYYSHS